jgi:hypothetical protein
MKWMTMREFLRGGYRTIDDITVVANHGRPVFTVTPLGVRDPQLPDAETPATRPAARGRTPRT